MAEMLKLDNIHKTFNPGTINEKIALNGVNLTLNEGDFVTVIGGNGAGKSTFLKILSGQTPSQVYGQLIPGKFISVETMSQNYPSTNVPNTSDVYFRIR